MKDEKKRQLVGNIFVLKEYRELVHEKGGRNVFLVFQGLSRCF